MWGTAQGRLAGRRAGAAPSSNDIAMSAADVTGNSLCKQVKGTHAQESEGCSGIVRT